MNPADISTSTRYNFDDNLQGAVSGGGNRVFRPRLMCINICSRFAVVPRNATASTFVARNVTPSSPEGANVALWNILCDGMSFSLPILKAASDPLTILPSQVLSLSISPLRVAPLKPTLVNLNFSRVLPSTLTERANGKAPLFPTSASSLLRLPRLLIPSSLAPCSKPYRISPTTFSEST